MAETLNTDATPKQSWQKVYDELQIGPIPMDDRPMATHISYHAKERPNAPAMVFLDKVFSYAEYDQCVSRLANALRGIGIKKGDVVGLLMLNIPQYNFTLGAISRLGAIGTGLSPLASPPELAYQIDDARAQLVIASHELAPKLSAIKTTPESLSTVLVTGMMDHIEPAAFDLPDIKGIAVFAYNDVVTKVSDQCEQAPSHPDDTFLLQYTGGTTGRPKGAQLSIRNIMHNTALVNAFTPPMQFGEEVYASPFPPFHIGGALGILGMARFGGLVFVQTDPRDLGQFIKTMKRFPPTRIGAVPALTEMLLADPEFASVDLSKLKCWGSGAAPISSETVKRLVERIGDGKLYDGFGMTETCGAYICNPQHRYKFGSVGIPVPETDVRIMDVETGLIEMPAGEPGEICASGPQVMKGYINLPDETANSLRDIGGRDYMYSGDVGYLDDEGFLFLCDRAKDMLIVGGFKVFSVEVEDKLSALPCVMTSALIGQPDEARPGNDIVHLFVQLADDHQKRARDELKAELMQFFADNMAVYKKPKVIHFLDAMPLTPVGKIDKKVLRASL